jgi:hypothetical protein
MISLSLLRKQQQQSAGDASRNLIPGVQDCSTFFNRGSGNYFRISIIFSSGCGGVILASVNRTVTTDDGYTYTTSSEGSEAVDWLIAQRAAEIIRAA